MNAPGARSSVVVDGPARVLQEAADAGGIGQQTPARRRERHAAAVPLEERRAQLVLEPADAGGDV